MDAVVDDATCTLDRRFAAQVGNAIFRDDDFDGVFAVIQVETIGTNALILPSFAVDGVVKMDNMAERVKSPEPPIPFIILVPDTWVELMLPNISASKAVLMATSRDGGLLPDCWRFPAGEAESYL